MKDNLTDITVILDRSGSMETVRADTIGGFNAFLKTQQQLPGDACLTLTQFDSIYEIVYADRAVKHAPELTHATFVPRGSTALLDAIGRTINAKGAQLEKTPAAERPGKVIFVIITDGAENASREFTRERINEMIELQRKTYSWDFVFLGANQDAIQAGASLGIAGHKSMSYAANPLGTQHAFRSVSAYVSVARNMAPDQLDAHSFTQEDRQNQEDAGAQP